MDNKSWVADDGNIYCPVNGWDCPYYRQGKCFCENVDIECDDFYFFWADEIEADKDINA
jgi:hypothetical protein